RPWSLATCASVGCQIGRSPSVPITTVFARSKTTESGTPPLASKAASSERTSDSIRSSATSTTCTQREYLSPFTGPERPTGVRRDDRPRTLSETSCPDLVIRSHAPTTRRLLRFQPPSTRRKVVVHSPEEFLHGCRFLQKVLGAACKSQGLRTRIRFSRENQNRTLLVSGNQVVECSHDVEAAQVRHRQIEHKEIGTEALKHLNRPTRVSNARDHSIAYRLQDARQDLDDLRRVVDDQNSCGLAPEIARCVGSGQRVAGV